MRITISGPPGSGKTSVCVLVADRLGFKHVLVGQIFREMAAERKLDLETFGRLAEENETIDKELDDRIISLARKSDDIVIEGRMTGALMKMMKVPVFAVYVTASEEVRVERIAKRENIVPDDVLQDIRARERSEKKRYLAYYGIDPSDRNIYDLWVDSTDIPAEMIADMVIARVKQADERNALQVKEGK
ncbi:MAG TPA: AAA family ATPase [Thermoplasmata archaeon]|nr:AAA family ATPase [Thermoplasmata archaeon]